MTDKILILSNCGSEEEASRIARELVNDRLAACVNIVAGVRSVYRWQGAIEEASEWTLLIKTQRRQFDAVASAIRRLHSYDLPEVIAVPVEDGSPAYLAWIDESLSKTTEP